MTAVRKNLHQAAPTGPAANAGADLGVELHQLVERRRLVGAIAEALDRGLEQARDLGEAERAVEEPGDGDLIGGDERGRRALPGQACLAGDPERGEARLVGGPELEPAGGREIDGDRRRRAPVGVGQGVLDRKPHVGGAQLGLQGAVDKANGRVDDALRVDHHLDRSVGDIVQPVRFDDFQALVGERRGVDRDLRAHRPRRVAEGLLGRDLREVRRPVEDRPARRRQDERVDARHPLPHQALPDRGMLGVDRRSQASGLASGSSGLVAATSAASARASGMTRWPPATSVSLLAVATTLPARRAAMTGTRLMMPPVPTTTRSTSSRVASSTSASGPETSVVPGGSATPAAAAGSLTPTTARSGRGRPARTARRRTAAAIGDEPEPVGQSLEDVERLAADRPGRAEHRDA